jgi:alkylated DNA nucleotide flippase Atl1
MTFTSSAWPPIVAAEGRRPRARVRHGGAEEQLRQLKGLSKEGIKFDKTGRYDLRKFLWEPPHRDA